MGLFLQFYWTSVPNLTLYDLQNLFFLSALITCMLFVHLQPPSFVISKLSGAVLTNVSVIAFNAFLSSLSKYSSESPICQALCVALETQWKTRQRSSQAACFLHAKVWAKNLSFKRHGHMK